MVLSSRVKRRQGITPTSLHEMKGVDVPELMSKKRNNMANDTLMLALNGDVTLQDFSKAMYRFKEIIIGLQEDVAPTSKIEWYVDELKAGSATAIIKGVPKTSKDIQAIKNIGSAYVDIGRRIVHGETLDNSDIVVNAITNLRELVNGRISSIIIQAAGKKYTIKQHTIFTPRKTYWDTETFGCVRGRVQSISERQYPHFTLYDYNDDHAILCSLPEGQKEKMRGIWGKLAYVEGTISRDENSDLVTSISNISNIEIIKEKKPKAWRQALGCLK